MGKLGWSVFAPITRLDSRRGFSMDLEKWKNLELVSSVVYYLPNLPTILVGQVKAWRKGRWLGV